jgi:glycosyltransferase involved in cell wall biosynthesis
LSDRPLVTAIIPTYQHACVVGDAVSSALAQTYPALEVLVVDDGSTDDTAEVLRGFGKRIRVICQANRGLSAARNRGITSASGELIAFLDADDAWMPSKIEIQVPLFRNPEVGLVGADMVYFDEAGDQAGTPLSRRAPPKGRVYPGFFTRDAVLLMPTVVARRRCFDDVGLFDESLRALEDQDMWHRISRRWALEYVSEPLARYRLSQGQMTRDFDRMLVNDIALREKCVADDPALLTIDRDVLEGCYYRLYLDLARQHMKRGEGREARAVLRRYRLRRGLTAKYLVHWVASWPPAWALRSLWSLACYFQGAP